MLLFGHKFIQSDRFYHILDIDSIVNTPPASTILIEFTQDNLDIIEYAKQNYISMALDVKDITQIIYANAFNSSYILVPKELAKTAQNLANNYLFDSKILVHIENEDEIEEMAILGVDGVIFKEAIIKITQ